MKIYRCKKCHWVCNAEKKGAIGTAHAHAEKHQGMTILGCELPASLTFSADPEKLGQHIEELYLDPENVIQKEVKASK